MSQRLQKSSRKRVTPRSRKIDENSSTYKAADVLRNQKRYMIPITKGVFNRTNCDVFRGAELLDAFVNASAKKDLLPVDLNIKDRPSALKICETMLKEGYFFEAELNVKSHRPNTFVEKPRPNSIKEDGYYIWVMPASLRQVYIYSACLVSFVLFICLIKVWPIWLKICIWWMSMIGLVSMLSIIVIRLVIYCLFWMVGVRDIWLLPNFLDDDADFEEVVTPLFGRGRLYEQKLAKKKAKLEKELREKHEREGTEAPVVKLVVESNYRFGMINLAAILSVGLVLCWQFGMFKGENIPDFLVNKNEIWNGYSFLLDDPTLYEEAMRAEEEAANDADAKEGEPINPAAAAAQAAADEEQARLDALMDKMMEEEDLDLDY